MIQAALAELDARTEGWIWFVVLILSIVVILSLVSVVRRMLLKPMEHRPSDISDAWAEAGRRLAPPPPEAGDEAPEDETSR
jgi:hypothetical protein